MSGVFERPFRVPLSRYSKSEAKGKDRNRKFTCYHFWIGVHFRDGSNHSADDILLREKYEDFIRLWFSKIVHLKISCSRVGISSCFERNYCQYGGTKIDSKLHKKYRIKFYSLDWRKTSEYEFDFLNQETISENLHRVTKGLLMKELSRLKI